MRTSSARKSLARFTLGTALNVFGFALLALTVVAWPARAQMGQVQSPPEKAECKFPDGKTVHVDYSSPRMRGRKIFGGLVVYGEVWRAGANEATTFITNATVNVGGKEVPAGSYTLFALPKPDSWKLIVSKQTGEWGIPYPGEDSDYARIPMQVSKLPSPLENFTISFDQAGDACTMHLDWETTRASITISEKK
jgi:Protein of unknown function (DUF2911)